MKRSSWIIWGSLNSPVKCSYVGHIGQNWQEKRWQSDHECRDLMWPQGKDGETPESGRGKNPWSPRALREIKGPWPWTFGPQNLERLTFSLKPPSLWEFASAATRNQSLLNPMGVSQPAHRQKPNLLEYSGETRRNSSTFFSSSVYLWSKTIPLFSRWYLWGLSGNQRGSQSLYSKVTCFPQDQEWQRT